MNRITQAENSVGRTFFPPDYIPKKYMTKIDPKSGKKIPTVSDVIKYVKDRNPQELEFEDSRDTRCMSFYGICE